MKNFFKTLFRRHQSREILAKVGQRPPNAPSSLSPASEDEALDSNIKNDAFPFLSDPDNKRNGKIARLPPRSVRDQINQRLFDGQSAVSIVEQLNQIPLVKAVLHTHFEGRPVSQQNLSEWKAGGYRDWLARQELLHHQKDFAADAAERGDVAEGMADSLFGLLLLDYARLLLDNAGKETPEAFEKKRKALSALSQDIVRLRRNDLQARRVEVQEAHLERTREKTAEEIFQKFAEWAENPAIRRAFFLLPQARQAELRARFKMPPTPEDEALLKEVESLKNKGNPTELQPLPTENSDASAGRSQGDEALTEKEKSPAPVEMAAPVSKPPVSPASQPADVVPRPVSSPIPTPETVTPDSDDKSKGSTSVPISPLRPISPISTPTPSPNSKPIQNPTPPPAYAGSPLDGFSEPCDPHSPPPYRPATFAKPFSQQSAVYSPLGEIHPYDDMRLRY